MSRVADISDLLYRKKWQFHVCMSKCFLIDGLNLIFRCFYGIPLLSSDQFPTNAVLGSVRVLLKMIREEQSEYIVFFLDKGRDPIRKALLPEYKANRLEVPDPVKIQIPVVKEFAYALGCSVIERSGIEADDLIASFAEKYNKKFDQIYIFSTDKDFAQCVRGNVYQMLPGSNKIDLGNCLDRNGIHEKFGVFPEQIVDYLSLIGDQADNIPGIRGVGPKTASDWLKQFQSIENILRNVDSLKPERFRALLSESSEMLRRNQQLITLKSDIEELHLEKNVPNAEIYHQLLDFYKLQSLKKEIQKKEWVQSDLFSS